VLDSKSCCCCKSAALHVGSRKVDRLVPNKRQWKNEKPEQNCFAQKRRFTTKSIIVFNGLTCWMTCDAEVGCDDLPGFAGISQGKREDDAKMEAALVERCKKILEETPQATSFFREVR